MQNIYQSSEQREVHDPGILAQARTILEACRSPHQMQEAVLAAVAHNEEWRGKQRLNLLTPEAPTSPTVRCSSFIARILIERTAPEVVKDEVVAFRKAYQTLYYCFENDLPDKA